MKYVLAPLAVACLSGLWFVWDEIPALRADGTVSVPIKSVALSSAQQLCPLAGETIELRGDSLVAGDRMGGAGGGENLAYGRVLGLQLGNPTQILIRGRGGFTAALGEQEWQNADPKGDIVFLAFGTNDAAPRGWLRRKSAVPIKAFQESLIRQIDRERKRGAVVALIAPPPGGSVAVSQRLEPYRMAVRKVGLRKRITVVDPADAFARCSGSEPLLARDALHLNAKGHRCLGQFLAETICPAG